MNEPAREFRIRGATTLIIVGAMATLAGLWGAVDSAELLIELDTKDQGFFDVPADLVARWAGTAIVGLAQTLACLLFTVMAVFMVSQRDAVLAVWTARLCAMAEIAWLVASMARNWDPGWKHVVARDLGAVFGLLSLGQALAWLVAASTPEPARTLASSTSPEA